MKKGIRVVAGCPDHSVWRSMEALLDNEEQRARMHGWGAAHRSLIAAARSQNDIQEDSTQS
jgi:hypothetical protein